MIESSPSFPNTGREEKNLMLNRISKIQKLIRASNKYSRVFRLLIFDTERELRKISIFCMIIEEMIVRRITGLIFSKLEESDRKGRIVFMVGLGQRINYVLLEVAKRLSTYC